MWEDPIVAEVRKHREAYAAQFNHDIDVIVTDIQEKQHDGKRKVVRLPPRRIQPVSSESSPSE